MRITRRILFCAALLALALPGFCQDYTRQEDVIYGRKFGMALVMDVFTPKQNANGAAIIFCVSGGWYSAKEMIDPSAYAELLKRGYTVFAVCHGSNPRFTIPDALQDMNRAVRFIRFHAAEYHVDPKRFGITGGSAGGHLSLMQGTMGADGDANAKDPVDRASSRVQAVACFFPPTDFLNYGREGYDAIGRNTLKDFAAPFAFEEWNAAQKELDRITDETKIRQMAQFVSPIYHISAQTPPTLIMHGDSDTLVPIQQSRTFIDKLKQAGVPCELVVKPGAGHGWANLWADMPTLANWFDKYLKKQ